MHSSGISVLNKFLACVCAFGGFLLSLLLVSTCPAIVSLCITQYIDLYVQLCAYESLHGKGSHIPRWHTNRGPKVPLPVIGAIGHVIACRSLRGGRFQKVREDACMGRRLRVI